MPVIDSAVMRSANKRSVLGHLYQQKVSSRVDISRATGINPATVSSLVDELIEEQFALEIGTGTSNGGRKPILVQFNGAAGYVIGVDVQITHVTTVLIDANQAIVFEHRRDIAAQPLRRSDLTELIADEIAIAQAQCPPSPHGLMGVGIGLPGIVNHREGRALYLPNLDIADWSIGEILSRHESLPIFVDNDANCGAWSEYLTTGIENLIFINAGIGLGTGLIISGQLYRGANGIAGEAGHHAIRADGTNCHCGNIGCWEQFASERGLAQSLIHRGIDVDTPLPPDFLRSALHRAGAGDTLYQEAFKEMGENLAVGLINLLNLLNPETIFMGGKIAEAMPLLLPTVRNAINERALNSNRAIDIQMAPPIAVARGAAGLALARAIDWLPSTI